jgi:hypothetical protein
LTQQKIIIKMAFASPALATPPLCTADFSLIPVKEAHAKSKKDQVTMLRTSQQIGSRNSSFSQQIADIQRLTQSSGLKYVLHATGTTLGTSEAETLSIKILHPA